MAKIDTIYDFSDKTLVELKSWLEPWFLTRRGGVAALADLDIVVYSLSGALTVGNGNLRWYAITTSKISLIHAALGTAPTGSGATVRVNRNGSSIGTVTIAAGAHTNTFVPASPSYTTGDYFTVDVTAVGSTVAGSDLVVQLQI